jgi:PIN domain nuclease of toxin-antitoxin system
MDYLHEIGCTTLGSTQVFNYLHQRINLQVCQKAFFDVVHAASRLSWTRDPFDRLITAQSAIEQNSLITKDKTILEHYEYAVW